MLDLKYALRSLRRSPGFTAVSVFLLAVGLGTTLAAFGLIDPLFLRPPHVRNPHEIVQVSSVDRDGRARQLWSAAVPVLQREPILRGVCGFDMPSIAADLDGTLRSRRTLTMSGDCFPALGLQTILGRPLTVQDDTVAAERVVLLTHAVWRDSFAGSPDVIGRHIKLAGQPFTVIGVVESDFAGFTPGFPADLIIPLTQTPTEGPPSKEPGRFWVSVLARVAPGVSSRQAAVRMQTLEKALLEQSAPLFLTTAQQQDYAARRVTVSSGAIRSETLDYGRFTQRFETPLFVFWGICSLVLLVGCVNLAILLLGRGLGRREEIQIRLSLGASSLSVVRLLVWECLLLVLAGAALALAVARWMNRAVASQAGQMFGVELSADSLNPGLDARTGLFFLGLVAFVAIVLSLGPAWQARRFGTRHTLRDAGRGVVGSSTRSQKVLLGVQLALTLALVSASAFFTTSIERLYQVDLGVQTDGISVARLARVPGAAELQEPAPYYRDLLAQLQALPDVSSSSLATYAPLGGGTFLVPVASAEQEDAPTGVRTLTAVVSERYFETLGIRIVAGEGLPGPIASSSTAPAEAVAVVSQSVARRFGNERLIGRSLLLGEKGEEHRLRIVGITANIRPGFARLGQGDPLFIYTSIWQQPDARPAFLLAKTRTGAPLAPDALRRVLASRGQHYVDEYRTLALSKDRALVESRLLANVSTVVGALSLFLAATGLFGLLSYYVASRTNEIGIRMALGAAAPDIQRQIVREMLPMMIGGTLGGVALTVLFGRLAGSLIYGVAAQAPWLLGVSVLILLATAALAAFIPSRRATSVDPMVALRSR